MYISYITLIGKKVNSLKGCQKRTDDQCDQPWHADMERAMHAHAKGAYSEAGSLYKQLLDEYPFLSRVAYNLGIVRNLLERYEDAEQAFRQALGYEPELFEAALNLAISIQEQGRFDEARQITAQIIHHWPGIPDSYFIHGCLLLLTGVMPGGWEGYEFRFDCLANPVQRQHPELSLPDGPLVAASRLLLSAEQGYGDALQMLRYIPLLVEPGYKVWIEAPQPLVSLFERLEGVEGVIPRGTNLPALDLHIPLMSLPRQFGTTIETIPELVTLTPAPELVKEMGELLPSGSSMRVGLAWSGRMEPPLNRKRSCPPELFSLFLDIPGITFVSLQKECAEGFMLTDSRMLNISDKLHDFHHTAALISSLDLVITIDTSIAHLAGTLGKPTWLLLPFVPDWRWLLERSDSPWYPSMRLFRQPCRKNWQPVITQVLQALALLLPDSAAILSNLGVLAEARGASTDALHFYQTALKSAPDSPIIQYNMGNTLKQLNNPDKARICYEAALQLQPVFPEAHHNLAILAQEENNTELAHLHIAAALAQRPAFADALHTLGELHQQEEHFCEAIAAFKSAIAADPSAVRSWNSLGIVYQCVERDSEAEPCYRQALMLNPEHRHARNNLGALLLLCGNIDESISQLEQLISNSSDYTDGHWNLACSLIARGDWHRGWEKFEYRFLKNSPVLLPQNDLPVWDGSELNGNGILLQGEQAFGDTIQFVRFAAAVAERGGAVHVACQHDALVALIASAKGVTSSSGPSTPVPASCVCRVPLMSLPHVLGLSLEQLPNDVPYLSASQDRLMAWREKMPDNSGIRIGICWSGRQTLRNRRRSCPPELLTYLGNIPGISLFSLQLGGAPAPPELPLVDLTAKIKDFADSAALISCLDLVITIDTSVAHLAGALGCPVWLMLPDTVDWRWMSGRTDSPWYPTMRLFRQKPGSGWQAVMEHVAEELRKLALPSLYIYQPGHDFQEPEHLAKRLVPLLQNVDQPTTECPAVLTQDKERADLLLFPYYLENLTEWTTIGGMWNFVEHLPRFKEREGQHIFFTDHDSRVPYHTTAWWFRASIDPLHRDCGSIPLSYQTEDVSEHLHYDAGKIMYHASFVGYLGHRKQRVPLLAGFARESRLAIFIETTAAFHGHQSVEEKAERRQRYLEICSRSLCILCPSGEGSNSIRFFETLSLGRLPVLISDAPLPFEDSIPYHRFVLRIKPEQSDIGGELLLEWLAGMGDEDPMARCREARSVWEKWFSPESLPARLWNELLRRYAHREALPACKVSTEEVNRSSPLTPDFYLQAGLTAANQGLFVDAEAAFVLASQYDHRCFDAYLQLGRLYAATGRDHAAVERFYEATLIRPHAPEGYEEAIPCLERLGRLDEVALCRSRIGDKREQEKSVDQLMAEGDHFREAEQWLNALESYTAILQKTPDNAIARLRAGGCLIFLNRHKAAIPHLIHATTLAPDMPDPHINLAFCYLSCGNWHQGWEEFEWRRCYINKPMPPFPELHRITSGEDLKGKTILVHTEQGYGDLLQFSRYIPFLASTGLEIHVTAPAPMVRLLRTVPGVASVIAHGDSLPATDYQTLLLSLPERLLAIQPTPLQAVPYLTADQTFCAAWKERLNNLSGLRIGIAWQGRNLNKSGYRRSLAPEQLAPILGLQGCSFVALQPEPLPDSLSAIHDFSAHLDDFADTAALISSLDLVITVDTSVAHLSGALDVPCWVMLLHAPDWRWYPLESDESSWYPGMRLFRQDTPGDWDNVVSQVASSLEEELLTRRGHQLAAAGLESDALACFRAATDHQGATAASWLNLGVALHGQGATREGCTALQHAVNICPSYAEAWQNLGLLYQALGKFDDAYKSFRQALQLRPGYPTARWNLSLLQLLLGDYEHGWNSFEARFSKQPPVPQRHAMLPRWQGEPLGNKTLLIHAEQGYGDTIQFLRFVPFLAQAADRVILEVQDGSLISLAQSLACNCTVVTRNDNTPEADLQIALMSVPGVLKTTLGTIPNDIPYLFANHERRKYWQRTIPARQGFRIGLCWKGRNEHVNDRFRSCPLSALAPLRGLPGIQWFSLQFGSGREELTTSAAGFPLIDLTASSTDFHDTAALMAKIDLVITVDTSVAHLAGATGRPTWLLLPFAPDWRWGLTADKTPWYPSMRLFRQAVPDNNWYGVVEQVVCALHEMLETSPDALK